MGKSTESHQDAGEVIKNEGISKTRLAFALILALAASGIPTKGYPDGAASPKTREALVGKQVAAAGEIATATRERDAALASIKQTREKWRSKFTEKGYSNEKIERWLDKEFPMPR